MRATRRNMDEIAEQSDFGVVFIPDNADPGEEYSANSGDYWQYGPDQDLGGILLVKRSVWVSPEHLGEFSDLLDTWDQTHEPADEG